MAAINSCSLIRIFFSSRMKFIRPDKNADCHVIGKSQSSPSLKLSHAGKLWETIYVDYPPINLAPETTA